jgi:hypothetical protein
MKDKKLVFLLFFVLITFWASTSNASFYVARTLTNVPGVGWVEGSYSGGSSAYLAPDFSQFTAIAKSTGWLEVSQARYVINNLPGTFEVHLSFDYNIISDTYGATLGYVQKLSPYPWPLENSFLSYGEKGSFDQRFVLGAKDGLDINVQSYGNSFAEFSNIKIDMHEITTPSPVPIPGAVWLLGSGLVGLIGVKRKILG